MDHRMIGSPLDLDPPSEEHVAVLRENKAWRAKNADILEVPSRRDGVAHVIAGERQTGKTHLAERWLREAPEGVTRVLITASGAHAEEVKARMGLPHRSRQVLSYRQLLNDFEKQGRPDDPGSVQYALDDVDHLLTELLGLPALPHLVTVCAAEPWQVTERDS